MSTETETDFPGGWEAMAAEYVLGLLPQDERAAFEAQMRADPDLEQDVVAWAEYFSTFTDDIPEEAPPPQLWKRISAQAFGTRRRPGWRLLLPYLAGGVAAAAITWGVYTSGVLTPQQGTHLYADLVAQDQGYVLLAHWAPDSETFMLRRDGGAFPTDNSIEIWVIPAADAAPVSVGLMAQDDLTQIPVPPEMTALMQPGAMVAISLEPLGGSVTGAPSGPVLALAALDIRS
ncbi:anti-sigma factor [Tropicibacter oceani]|uniref:Regulator of SigK n=1 Tax=Tropicibacter oceani TaxID=3058420 RepID=A0ABY8QGI6_9RHOB|nr:anti-sigma factor [Tropicibacter oceani]WGW03287.1 anti-sigma factor [Tropicibacter oceani]